MDIVEETEDAQVVEPILPSSELIASPLLDESTDIKIRDFEASSGLSESDLSKSSENAKNHIVLKGCKRISEFGLYELDLGQQDLLSSNLTRKITLELVSGRSAYVIRTISEADKSWIIPSRYDGILESSRGAGRDSHSITVSFMTGSRGIFTTYIIIENLDNVADTKTIRVYLEVVAKQNIRRHNVNLLQPPSPSPLLQQESSNHVFDVYISGADAEKSYFEMNAFYWCEYNARSFLICNRESVPLEIVVKSNLSLDDPSELVFSLSRHSPKMFRALTIEPLSQVRVYVQFTPIPESQFDGSLVDSEKSWDEKLIEIYFNCRLIKDYQKTISMKVFCKYHQIGMCTKEAVFTGKLEKVDSVWQPFIKEAFIDIEVENMLQEPLLYEVMNDNQFFSIVDADTTRPFGSVGLFTLGPRSKGSIRIHPVMEVIQKHVDYFRKVLISFLHQEKYFESHMTVYNKQRPSEKRFIIVKLSFGYHYYFQLATCSRASFFALEGYVIRLIRDIDSLDIFRFDALLEERDELFFIFRYTCDQLVFYGTREYAGEVYLQLANLLFFSILQKSIFKELSPSLLNTGRNQQLAQERTWPPFLAKWV